MELVMHRSQQGFTLIELMVTVVLVALMATIAIPGFTELIRDNRVQAQAEELNSLLQYARSEAVIRKRSVNVSISTTDGVANVISAGEVIRSSTLNTSSVDLDVSTSVVSFRPNGTSSTVAFRATVCPDGAAEKGYVISVLGSGRVSLHPRGRDSDGTALGSCS